MDSLIIFIKNPELGKVKTRLAKTVGDVKALEVYLQLLQITTSNVLMLNDVKRYLYYSDVIAHDDIFSESDFVKKTQHGSDLGQRMSNAFDETIANGASKAVIMGSDCPELDWNILQDAFIQLEDYDVVIGPAKDGGYYLLGMKGYYPSIFKNVAWSTESVLHATVENIKNLGLNYVFLPLLSDLDNENDWLQFKELGVLRQ